MIFDELENIQRYKYLWKRLVGSMESMMDGINVQVRFERIVEFKTANIFECNIKSNQKSKRMTECTYQWDRSSQRIVYYTYIKILIVWLGYIHFSE